MNNAAGTVTKPEAGVMVASPATMPEATPSTLGLPLCSHSIAAQLSAAPAAEKCVAANALRGQRAGVERAAGVEAKPADPEQPRADQAQHDIVRRHRLARVTRCACPAPARRPAPKRPN